MRGLQEIEKNGTTITTPEAWLRRVSTFIMLDMVKVEKKNRQLKQKNVEIEVSNSLNKLELEEEIEALNTELRQLSEEDQEILKLRFHENMKYKDIQQHLLDEYGTLIKVSTLRKRESRAIERLRNSSLKEFVIA